MTPTLRSTSERVPGHAVKSIGRGRTGDWPYTLACECGRSWTTRFKKHAEESHRRHKAEVLGGG